MNNRKKEQFVNIEPQDKSKRLLPNELIDHIASFTDTPTLVHRFSLLSKGTHTLVSRHVTERRRTKELLKHVMDGNPIAAENLLKQHQQEYPNSCLVTLQTNGKEKNGREWDEPVSALEFSAWTGDVTDGNNHKNPGMVNMLLKYVPLKHREEALEQLKGVREHSTQHGKVMAPFYALISDYLNYYNNFYEFGNFDNREEYCVKKIGKSQNQLPIFGLQWFCDKKPFHASAKHAFKRAPERILFNGLKPFDISQLGTENQIYKAANMKIIGMHLGTGNYFYRSRDSVIYPRAALEKLCEESIINLDMHISLLEENIEANNQSQLKRNNVPCI